MKKLLILAILFSLHQGLLAQTSQGSFVATGYLGYSGSNKNGTENLKVSSYSYSISPRLGYIISENLEIGFFGTLRKSEEKSHIRLSGDNGEHGRSKTTVKSIGAYLKKYLFITDKLAFSGTGEISYNSYRSTILTYAEGLGPRQIQHDYLYETTGLEAAIRPGFSYFLSDKIALNASYGALTYNSESVEYSDWQHHYPQPPQHYGEDSKTHKLKLDVSSASSSLGLSYFF